MSKVSEFIDYLNEQVKNHSIYVWGAQGQCYPTITAEWIRKRETTKEYADQAIAFWEKQCKEGYEKVLRAFDCSGLGMYWLQNLQHIYKSDMNANAMYGKCEKVNELKAGYWVFRLKDEKAIHIGYMVSDTDVVHAKGRSYGVVREKYKPSYWQAIGKPSCFDFESVLDPQPEPQPEPVPTQTYVKVLGSVHVRLSPVKGKILLTAHKGDLYPCEGSVTLDDGAVWYLIETDKGAGYISAFTNLKRKYTELVEVEG